MKVRSFMVLASLFVLLPSFGMAQGGWIALSGQVFIAKNSAHEWNNVLGNGAESYFYSTLAGSPQFFASVVFPPEADGLSVRQINATVGDDDVGSSMVVNLYRMNRYSGVTQRVFRAETGAAATPGKTVISDTTGGYKLIDNHKYAWFVRVDFNAVPLPNSNLRLYAVRIQYQ